MVDFVTVLRRLARALLPAYGILLLAFVLPRLPLDGLFARFAYWVAEAGDTLGSVALCGVLVTAIVVRAGVSVRRRATEATAIVVAAVLFLGLGSYVNEFGIKPWFGQPRPNILELEADGTLQLSATDFYALGDKVARTAYLTKRLLATDYAGPVLDLNVRDHWAHMTGYSFPSGHSFAAMLLATFFLGIALSYLPPRRAGVFYLLVPWAVLICYSRVVLRVHSPTDVAFGALQGILVGILALVVVRAILGAATADDASPLA